MDGLVASTSDMRAEGPAGVPEYLYTKGIRMCNDNTTSFRQPTELVWAHGCFTNFFTP